MDITSLLSRKGDAKVSGPYVGTVASSGPTTSPNSTLLTIKRMENLLAGMLNKIDHTLKAHWNYDI